MLKRFTAVKLLLALIWASALAVSFTEAQTNSLSLPLKARQVIGMKVENSDAQRVGTVRNLVLDMKTGKLRYVVIGSGGFLGVRATLKIAPSRAISAATTKRQTLAVNATTTQWDHAPVFKLSGLLSLGDPNHAREIFRNFGTGSLSTTGRETVTNPPSPELKFASDLIGMRVVNQKQEKVGEVLDLLVGFGEPRPTFAIISSGRLWGHQYAVPLTALNSPGKGRSLMLNADMSAWQQAPPFNQQAWETGATNGSSQVYRYSTPGD